MCVWGGVCVVVSVVIRLVYCGGSWEDGAEVLDLVSCFKSGVVDIGVSCLVSCEGMVYMVLSVGGSWLRGVEQIQGGIYVRGLDMRERRRGVRVRCI